MTKLWVDPPGGWKYGFPKLWNKEIHPNMNEWLVDNGYPAIDIELPYVRMWECADE